MYLHVTGPTDYQRFSLSCCHQLDPCWPFFPPLPFEVCEFSDMMDFDIFGCLAEFTGIRQKSLQDLCPCVHWFWALVENGCLWAWDELQAPKLGNKWLLSFSLYYDS